MMLPKRLIEYKLDVYLDKNSNEYYLFILQEDDIFKEKYYYAFMGDGNQIWDFVGKRAGYIGANIMKGFSFYGYFNEENCTMIDYVRYCRQKINNAEDIESLFDKYSIVASVEKDKHLNKLDSDLKKKIYNAINHNDLKFIGEQDYSFKHLYKKEVLGLEELRSVIKTLPIIKTEECISRLKLMEK